MKLVKCKKCGATIMTGETLLSGMQVEYNELVKKALRAKGADKQIFAQQLKHISKTMTAICHSTSESEIRKINAYNELSMLKQYIIDKQILSQDILDKIRSEARELTKKKSAEDEKKIAELYGDFENRFCNRTKQDTTCKEALRGGEQK